MYKLRSLSFLCILFAVYFAVVVASRGKNAPHILLVVADDLGWSDVGFHGSKIQTPNIDNLAAEGVILDNYYVLPICTPTRSALMTGMYPIHTGMQQFVLLPASPYGLPLNFTTLPQKLKESGYATHMVGKWHLGYNKWEYTPTYRGFDSFYGFYNYGGDHYTHKFSGALDFRDNKEPVKNLDGTYGTFAFAERAKKVIESHNSSNPLFLYVAFQNAHEPVQAPKQYTDKHSFIKDITRRTYAGMVNIMDEAIGNITEAMKDSGLWEDTLMVFTTDNGGFPLSGGYNWPLRGGKFTLWEGGVRGVSFVHGNMLRKKGVKCKELMHVTDWYATLVNVAGVTHDTDSTTLDGMNMWSTISDGEPSPRKEILINLDTHPGDFREGIALRSGDMKLLVSVPPASSYKPPEIWGTLDMVNQDTTFGMNEGLGWSLAGEKSPVNLPSVALYNITADPTECDNLSRKHPDLVRKLQERVQFYMKSVVPPLNKPQDLEAIMKAMAEGVWTPWQD